MSISSAALKQLADEIDAIAWSLGNKFVKKTPKCW